MTALLLSILSWAWPYIAGALGVLALVFQQTADLAVGFGLRGMTVQSQLDYFARPAGWIYGACLIAFALTPLIMRKR